MEWFDRYPDVPGGGRASGSGSFYHLSFRSGSRAGGACAGASYDYVAREGEFDAPDRDPALHTESGNMPSWAEDSPRDYWDAADLHERANGRLYVSADFALPRDLDPADQVALACEFARELTEQEHLPYTLAIHAGRDDEGEEHNPHAHLMFSERRNDGIERSREVWFHRANSEYPERGGAPKSRTFHGPDWIEKARERWADLTNEALARHGSSERVDHRSYERQGLDREPDQHYGPSAAHVIGRGQDHERLDQAVGVIDDAHAIREIDGEIARLEAVRNSMLERGVPDEQPDRKERDYSHSSRGDASGDRSWER
jgi:hypothetical protein